MTTTLHGKQAQAPRADGVALVITLIMLSLITLLTVTFLLVSRRERRQISQAAEASVAETAATAARDRAVAELQARIFTQNDMQALDFLESTNVDIFDINGTTNGLGVLRDPRVTVVVANDPTRYYVDLNRNTNFDPVLPETPGDPQWIGMLKNPYYGHSADNQFLYRYAYIALPEGLTLDINAIHNQSKRLGPAQEGFLRNQGFGSWELNLAAFLSELDATNWTYLSYLWDFDTNAVTYKPSTGTAFLDGRDIVRFRYATNYLMGIPAITNRTIFPWYTVAYPYSLAASNFMAEGIDSYGNGPVWANATLPRLDTITPPPGPLDPRLDNPWYTWPGAPSVNSFFSLGDLFDTTKSPSATGSTLNFVKRLRAASNFTNGLNGATVTHTNTYYELIRQLGMNSAPVDDSDLINLNFRSWNTNAERCLSWNPSNFFMLVANRLITNHVGQLPTGITNIMIWPTNMYTHELHQLLQLTANIFDSTRTNSFNTQGYYHYPSCFRPVFRTVPGSNWVLITGYTYVDPATNGAAYLLRATNIDLATLATNNLPDFSTAPLNNSMCYGIPLIVGARKGFPNFNEFSLHTYVEASRRLQVVRNLPVTSIGSKIISTNQMYVLGMSNIIGVELWNSYVTNLPFKVSVRVTNFSTATLTNETGILFSNMTVISNYLVMFSNDWKGWLGPQGNFTKDKSFVVAISNCVTNLPKSAYYSVQPAKPPIASDRNTYAVPTGTYPRFLSTQTNMAGNIVSLNYGFDTNTYAIPQGWLKIRNKLICAIVDETDPNHLRILDYVLMDGLVTETNLPPAAANADLSGGDFWNTNRVNGSTAPNAPTVGVVNQLQVSAGNQTIGQNFWRSFSDDPWQGMDRERAQDTFAVFMGLSPHKYKAAEIFATNTAYQAPFTPSLKLYQYKTWQANDPLVHYLVEDIADHTKDEKERLEYVRLTEPFPTADNLGKLNPMYRPWGGNPQKQNDANLANEEDLTLKDALVRCSDDWQFPCGKYANIGMLGRVHRGTPWQTVYFKSKPPAPADWLNWAQNRFTNPTNDWQLVDMFTTAPHPNATRGLLPINQTGRAAWAAALGGMIVLMNTGTMPDFKSGDLPGTPSIDILYTPTNIVPNSPEFETIYNGIQAYRYAKEASNPTNLVFPHGRFNHISDLLGVPELTVNSPYLNTKDNPKKTISDAGYERIPELLMSLLRMSQPRYVVYAWGQALRPAPQSISFNDVVNGKPGYMRLCLNYQVTAEFATRTVLRFEDISPTPPPGKQRKVLPRPVIEDFNFMPPD